MMHPIALDDIRDSMFSSCGCLRVPVCELNRIRSPASELATGAVVSRVSCRRQILLDSGGESSGLRRWKSRTPALEAPSPAPTRPGQRAEGRAGCERRSKVGLPPLTRQAARRAGRLPTGVHRPEPVSRVMRRQGQPVAASPG